jgi:hypothetical protein
MDDLRSVPGFPGILVSANGQVYSKHLKRMQKPTVHESGYHIVSVVDDTGRPRSQKVHRLIAAAFLPDFDERSVDHINQQKHDNRAVNLRMADPRLQNQNRTVSNLGKGKRIAVEQLDKDGSVVRTHVSVNEAARYLYALKYPDKEPTNRYAANISNCINNPDKFKSAYKFKWRRVTQADTVPNEEWKPFHTVEVSNMGRIRRTLADGTVSIKACEEHNSTDGYPKFWTHGANHGIHLVVATLFIGERPSPEHVVDHLDGNKRNAQVSNLEWVTRSENTQRAYDNGQVQSFARPVKAFRDDVEIGTFGSIKEAAIEMDVDASCISKCMAGKLPSVKGFKFVGLERV